MGFIIVSSQTYSEHSSSQRGIWARSVNWTVLSVELEDTYHIDIFKIRKGNETAENLF